MWRMTPERRNEFEKEPRELSESRKTIVRWLRVIGSAIGIVGVTMLGIGELLGNDPFVGNVLLLLAAAQVGYILWKRRVSSQPIPPPKKGSLFDR